MGLMDSILGGALGKTPDADPSVTPQQNAGLAGLVLDMFSKQGGGQGLDSLAASFAQKGLSHLLASWVGTGENLPASPDQISHVLGNEQVEAMAARVGLPPEAASAALARLLPMLVDRATPTGQMPQGDALQDGIAFLRKSLGA
jgi:uncharacterized protein YidB (DUF937 family)